MTTDRPHFSPRTGGYALVPRRPAHWWSKTLFDFYLDAVTPLTFHEGCVEFQPDQHFRTDGGSIPKLVQLIPAFDSMRYARPYAVHDSNYRHHYIFERPFGAINMRRRAITRAEADVMLYTMLIAEGATQATARTVYRAVRSFGGFVW
jgi:hypothetical protein